MSGNIIPLIFLIIATIGLIGLPCYFWGYSKGVADCKFEYKIKN